jgi:hypothetical protein
MKLIPKYLLNHGNRVILTYNMDMSHDQVHFINTAEYAYRLLNSDELKNKTIIKGYTREDVDEIIVLSAYSHDLIDGKYMNEDEGLEKLNAVFIVNNYNLDKLKIINYIITHISFSKRREREKLGLPLFEDHPYKFAAQIVCDADQLDAYRVERIISYQNRKKINDIDAKKWCKTIIVKRVLKYIDSYMNTETAKEIAQDMHNKVVQFVEKEYKDLEMFDY